MTLAIDYDQEVDRIARQYQASMRGLFQRVFNYDPEKYLPLGPRVESLVDTWATERGLDLTADFREDMCRDVRKRIYWLRRRWFREA